MLQAPAKVSFPPRSFPGCLVSDVGSHSTSSLHSVIIIALYCTYPFVCGSPRPGQLSLQGWAMSLSPLCPKYPGRSAPPRWMTTELRCKCEQWDLWKENTSFWFIIDIWEVYLCVGVHLHMLGSTNTARGEERERSVKWICHRSRAEFPHPAFHSAVTPSATFIESPSPSLAGKHPGR